MKNMMAMYLLEKQGLEYYEDKDFFLTYKIVGENALYVGHLWARPKTRTFENSGKYWKVAKEIAQELQCNMVLCDVDLRHNNPEKSLQFLLRVGFKIAKLDLNLIYLYKNIDEE